MAELANIAQIPVPTKEKGQRSIPVSEAFFARIVPSWSQPSELMPNQWRHWVKSQPIAVTCKETMISNISDLDWKITPRDSDQRDELNGTIKHYTKLLQHGGEAIGMDWVSFLEWSLSDLLDLPFGTAWEVLRKGDSPDGRVMALEPIDGGTCYPTNNKNYPVYQYYNGFEATFPAHAIARMYMNPRTEIERKGWGIAPPEKIFLAMEMLARGDRYYANLLLDIPPAGVFDLGDITWEDANTWIASFRTAVSGVGSADSFKIPVLAEHTGKVEFIPLGKAPNDIMYDRITLKYASLVCAGYGMNLGDIGVASASSSGETLAGSIRGEQKTNRTGKARVKAKLKYFIESFLPDMLQFDFIDTDGERLSMLGRARLANATAFNQLRDLEAISPEEARLQIMQDGLMTISMPEKPPKEAKKPEPKPFGQAAFGNKKPPERPGQVGAPQAPSLGGDGEVKKSAEFKVLPSKLESVVERIVSVLAPNIREALDGAGEDNLEPMKSLLLETVFSEKDELGLDAALGKIVSTDRIGDFVFDGAAEEIESLLAEEGLYGVNIDSHVDTLRQKCEQEFPAFIGKAIFYTLVNSEYLFSGDVVERVQERIERSLSEYVSSFIGMQLGLVMEEIRRDSLEVPEVIRMKAIAHPATHQITVEAPKIELPKIEVTVPERMVQIAPPNVTVESSEVNVNVQPTPIEVKNTVEVEPTPIEVTNNIQPAEVNVDVNPTPIEVKNNVSVEKSDVNVQVNPTPVQVSNDITVQPAEVSIPKRVREVQQVVRDINQNIDHTITDVTYEEDK